MTTFEDLYAEYQPTIAGVAAEYGAKARRWGAEASDFAQEFACWMLENEAWLAGKRAEIEDPDEFGRFLARCLRNEAKDYMLDIRDQAGGQPRRDAYFYTEGEVKALLPLIWDIDQWTNPPQSEDGGRSSKPANEGGNWIATLADVSRAFSQLDHEDKHILQMFHRDNYRNKEMAQVYKTSEATMSYRHGRAVKRLLKLLGGPKPRYMRPDDPYNPWRGRHAVSNAHARALTRSTYEDDE